MAETTHQPVKIVHLGEHPEFIPTVAEWHQNEWQHISPELTTDIRINLYKSYSCNSSIPFGLLALQNNKAVGSASIVTSDMHTHEHLSPWLASVYVHPDFRQQGIATQLIDNCIKLARKERLKSLYLFTPEQMLFYQKRGWKLMESMTYHNEPVDIMTYSL